MGESHSPRYSLEVGSRGYKCLVHYSAKRPCTMRLSLHLSHCGVAGSSLAGVEIFITEILLKQMWNPQIINLVSLFLTHICLVDPSILINWKSPFPILGVSGVLFYFYSISNIPVKTLIRRRVLGLHCLPMSQKWDARLILVSIKCRFKSSRRWIGWITCLSLTKWK